MFLKPEATKDFAARVSHAFALEQRVKAHVASVAFGEILPVGLTERADVSVTPLGARLTTVIAMAAIQAGRFGMWHLGNSWAILMFNSQDNLAYDDSQGYILRVGGGYV